MKLPEIFPFRRGSSRVDDTGDTENMETSWFTLLVVVVAVVNVYDYNVLPLFLLLSPFRYV